MLRIIQNSCTYVFLLFPALQCIAQTTEEAWEQVIAESAFVKSGIESLNHRYYQYESLGLGGTTMRVSPHGFTSRGAPGIGPVYYLEHLPYLLYQYWWDEEAHRHRPFALLGGYGNPIDAGEITSFNHNLDIKTGVLNIRCGLKVGNNEFTTERELFISPNGVLVMRIIDSEEASLPLQLSIDINEDVRIYNNLGIYDTPHDPWTGEAFRKDEGAVVKATRPGTCVATLAVAVEAPLLKIDTANLLFGSDVAGDTVIFYIAPGSSYESEDAETAAWEKADFARNKGFNALREETSKWWANYYAKSAIRIPDATMAKTFAQSLYYHGVHFGNTDIPPGCNATSIEAFAGAVCPEYDLVFSQLAMLYTGHFEESRGISDWLYEVLPRAEQYATEGLTHHNVTVRYNGGAKYITLMGYDGSLLVQPTVGEGINAYSIYPGANAAFMAFSYVDFSSNGNYTGKANDILKKTTQVSLEQLRFDNGYSKYVDRYMPNTVQQSAAIMGLRECFERGIAEPSWEKYRGEILLPTGDLNGSVVIAGGVGAIPVDGVGDATWLSSIWWHGNTSKDDPLFLPSYENSAKSKTGDYVFNNGWMGVCASKLFNGDEANYWLNEFLAKDVRLFDNNCFGEIVFGIEDYKKTPEIGAHGTFICNISQMLLDPDDKEKIDVFPAIAPEWEEEGVGFSNLMAKGNIAVSGEYNQGKVNISLENRSDSLWTKTLRTRLGSENPILLSAPEGTVLEGDLAILNITLQSKEKRDFEFVYDTTSTSVELQNLDKIIIYPNPSINSFNIKGIENIESITIHNLNGEVVKCVEDEMENISTIDINPGLYIIAVKANNKTFRSKLIVN